MNTSYMDTSDSSDNPIDLSRRCDSVETRKTPSPYNSSSCIETSPSLENESPTSKPRKKVIIRSETPPNSYQSNDYSIARDYSTSPQSSSRFPYPPLKRSPPSPEPHHRYSNEKSVNANAGNEMHYDDIMRAVALRTKLQSIPASVSAAVDPFARCPSSPESASNSQYPMMMGRDGKLSRPFKAYPRDPLSNPFASPIPDSITDRDAVERFAIFRQQMLQQIHAANGGRATITNPNMRRTSVKHFKETDSKEMSFETQQGMEMPGQNCPSDSSETSSTTKLSGVKDSAYFERRRKNNAAAKKSRDRRRRKEDDIAIRAAFLETENSALKLELKLVKQQLARFTS